MRAVRDVQRRGYPITIHERDVIATRALSADEWEIAKRLVRLVLS